MQFTYDFGAAASFVFLAGLEIEPFRGETSEFAGDDEKNRTERCYSRVAPSVDLCRVARGRKCHVYSHLRQLDTDFACPSFRRLIVDRALVANEALTHGARFFRIEEHFERLETSNATVRVQFFRAGQVFQTFLLLPNDRFQFSERRRPL